MHIDKYCYSYYDTIIMNIHCISIKRRFVFLIVVVVLFYSACRPKTIPFVVVREADFRVGPVDLPLNDEGKKIIENFLLKGGDKSRSDIVDPGVPKEYAGLFTLLSDSTFLHRHKFRKDGEMGKISKNLEQWFEKSIVYSVIDSQNKRPFIIAPISIKDKNKKYWWVFYMPPSMDDLEDDPRIIQVLITATVSKDVDKY